MPDLPLEDVQGDKAFRSVLVHNSPSIQSQPFRREQEYTCMRNGSILDIWTCCNVVLIYCLTSGSAERVYIRPKGVTGENRSSRSACVAVPEQTI